jgi:hypothetical protein
MNALGGAVGTPAEAGRGSGRLARQSATEYEAKIFLAAHQGRWCELGTAARTTAFPELFCDP